MLAEEIADCFAGCFKSTHNTLLLGGADEPLYEPGEPSRIYFRDDYASSALHEAAHWCIAGAGRRRMTDYGYWYEDEGCRDPVAQRRFELAEVRPQGLEWILSKAANVQFRVSADNFNDGDFDLDRFRREICNEVILILEQMPPRAWQFANALMRFSGMTGALDKDNYQEMPR